MPPEQPLVTRTGTHLPTPVQASPWPISDLNRILQACNPGKPLKESDSRRADFKALRQGSSIGPLQTRLLRLLDEGEYHHVLLCGHRGSGKSTELLALQDWADEKGFLAIWAEVDEWYGMTELDYSDIFLLAAVLVEKAMQDFGKPLPSEKISRIVQWFKERIVEDTEERKSEIGVEVGAQLGGSLPFSIGSLFAKLTASFKGTSSHSAKTRETLRRYPNDLIDFSADLLKTANETLQNHGKPHGILLIFDNLDRYDPVNVDAIMVRASQQMRQLACHAVFTYPIALAYRPITGKVSAEYDSQVTLPMLALRSKSMSWGGSIADTPFHPERVAALRSALAQRIRIEDLFERSEDADYLIRVSGGAIRDMIRLVADASNYAQEGETRLSSAAVQSAVEELRSVYKRLLTLTPHDYRCLAAFAKRAQVEVGPDDFGESINRLLFNGCLLEYLENGESWLDVHPILVETEEFRNACVAHDKPGA